MAQRVRARGPRCNRAMTTMFTHSPRPMSRRTAAAACVAAALLASGCATGPQGGSAGSTPAGSEADRRAAAPAALMAEQQWLQQWFSGTPVAIAQERSGALRVDVPDAFAFDAGQAAVKPALAAVLDRVAESMRRRDLLVLTVAPPAGGEAGLGRRRVESMTRHLTGRGVDAGRIAPAAADGPVVGLRLRVNPAAGA